jgi:uncharacterized protein
MTHDLRPGSICWPGLATSDPAAAKPFYERLFGWESQDLGDFSLLRRDGRAVAILYRQTPQARRAGVRPHWTTFVLTTDAGETAAHAGELGGAAVFRAPFNVGEEGLVAAIRDPVGAQLSLWQPGARRGAELFDVAGALAYAELATDDTERSRDFYAALFAWSIDGAAVDTGGPVGALLSSRPGAPEWLPWFRVHSVDAAIEAVTRERGILVASRQNGAVLGDPQGATFGVTA